MSARASGISGYLVKLRMAMPYTVALRLAVMMAPSRGDAFCERLELAQGIELVDVAGCIDACGNERGAPGLDSGRQRIDEGRFVLYHGGIGSEGRPKFFPVDPAEFDAVARNVLDLLLDADETDFRVVEHQHDDGQVLALGGLQLGDGHQEAAVPAKGNDRPLWVGEPGAKGTGDRVPHRSQSVGSQKFACRVGRHFCTTNRRLAPASQVAMVSRGSTARAISTVR